MPELPEVQTVVDDLIAAHIPGQSIADAGVFWNRSIAQPPVRLFRSRVRGRTICAIRRRGKYIVFDLDGGGCLLLHLRMTGRLHLAGPDMPRLKHEHVVLTLSDSRQLRLHDTRKFARFFLPDDAGEILGRLGPEPLEPGFTAALLERIVHTRKRSLKPLLLDQQVIAGIGNIYADEALWDAGLHPIRTASSLQPGEVRALHRSIRKVLKRGLSARGTSLGNGMVNFYSVARRRGRNRDRLMVFRRTDEPCPKCSTPIRRIIVGQRSTHICPLCQRM